MQKTELKIYVDTNNRYKYASTLASEKGLYIQAEIIHPPSQGWKIPIYFFNHSPPYNRSQTFSLSPSLPAALSASTLHRL